MNALASFVNIGEVDGLVEADETFSDSVKKAIELKVERMEKELLSLKRRNLKKHIKNEVYLSNR